MNRWRWLVAAALGCGAAASAQDVLLVGQVRQVIVERPGEGACPSVCPVSAADADGKARVCVANDGGCQTMDVDVERIVRGDVAGTTRRFGDRVGEWGPTFPAQGARIVVGERDGRVAWAPVLDRAGRPYVDVRRLRGVVGLPADGGQGNVSGNVSGIVPVDALGAPTFAAHR